MSVIAFNTFDSFDEIQNLGTCFLVCAFTCAFAPQIVVHLNLGTCFLIHALTCAFARQIDFHLMVLKTIASC